MKKKLFLVAGALVLTVSAVGGATYAGMSKEKKVQLLEQRLVEFKANVDNDIAESFDVNLDNLEKLDHKEILNDENQIAIAKKYMEVSMEQEVGDIQPSIYLDKDKNELYILEKKAEGKNILHKYEQKQTRSLSKSSNDSTSNDLKADVWSEVSTDKAKGKVIDFEEVK
ncbi:hypothetical protein JNUCC42_04420 [Brevibacterium sp. JNUCC-42]|nr:hypothetical protein JNUCC42_04420 [Brevibacterium sp. JNUCC-42]